MAQVVGGSGVRGAIFPLRPGGKLPPGGSAVRDFPAAPERKDRRPNTAPAYYLGHPAGLWITAMRPRRRRTALVNVGT